MDTVDRRLLFFSSDVLETEEEDDEEGEGRGDGDDETEDEDEDEGVMGAPTRETGRVPRLSSSGSFAECESFFLGSSLSPDDFSV